MCDNLKNRVGVVTAEKGESVTTCDNFLGVVTGVVTPSEASNIKGLGVFM